MPAPHPATDPRRILLVDADAFYVSVARLEDPDGAGREPLLIVGGTAEGRGVVTSASYECRAFGVRSAMPTAQALRLCPRAVVVPVSREACSAASRAIRAVLDDFTPDVEPASIDEFYLDLSGTERLHADPTLEATARRIRHAVHESTGLDVSIGGGTSRLIAKMAAREAKPRRAAEGRGGVYLVPPGEELEFMRARPLAAIPGIGPRFQDRLQRYGLRQVADVLPRDVATLIGWFGPRGGRWLFNCVRGIDHSPVVRDGRRKSVGHEETFARDLNDDDDLHTELTRLTTSVARDLRRTGHRARTMTVKLRDADFTTRQASVTLPEAVSTDRILLATARDLLARLRRSRRAPARLLGVTASGLTAAGGAGDQLPLFEDGGSLESDRDLALASAVDGITQRFGRTGVRRGVEMRHPGCPPSRPTPNTDPT